MHHRAGVNNNEVTSRHPWKKQFEKRYGTEWVLYEEVKKNVEILLQMQQVIPRRPDGSEVYQGKEKGC
jgi:hypothetical protein